MTQVKRRGDCIGAPRAVLPAGAVSTHFPACFRRPATAHRTVQRSRRRATWSTRPGDAGCTPCTRRATRAGSRRTQPDRSRAGPCLSVSNALRTRTDTSFETVWRIRVIRHLPNDGIPDPASAVVRAVQANPRRRDDRSREQGIWCCRLERNACSFACTGSRRARDAPVRSTMRGHARLRSHGTTCRQPPAASRHLLRVPTARQSGTRQLPGGTRPLTAAKPRVCAFRFVVVAWKSGVHRPALSSGSLLRHRHRHRHLRGAARRGASRPARRMPGRITVVAPAMA